MRARHRRLRPFHVKHLEALPATCRSCPLGPLAIPALRDAEPAGWVRASEGEWGQAGVSCWDDGQIVGYLLVSTPLHVPRSGPQSGVAQRPDAAVVMSLRVIDEYARLGIGRQLVQAAAAMIARGPAPFRALEVEATRAVATCALPSAEFLTAVGFEICRPDPVRPRLRLDVDRAVRWRPHLNAAVVDRLTAWARPLPAEPANREG
ncbi:GNAT family N-acetyltransferase [Mariniluteicoccus endophyticus]